MNGSPIDPDTVNALLLGGIVNILCQSEAFEEADSRIKALEIDNISNKARMEALESQVLKQNDKILELNDKLLEIENGRTAKEPELQGMVTDLSYKIKCETCGKTFQKNCELEMHMEEHDAVQKLRC